MATEKKTTTKAPAKSASKAPAKAVAKKPAAPKAPVEKKVVPAAAGSLEATIYGINGASTGTISLPAELFGVKWNADLVHQVVVGMQANARTPVAHTKNRGEVAGGGKKPWKQKGTGRARHGSNRSPIWRGGGVTFGPRADKIYAVKINRKMRGAALASVLSQKLRHGEVIFVDSFAWSTPKTKDAKAALVAIAKAVGKDALATRRRNAAIIAIPKKDVNVEKSFSNITGFMSEEVRNLNPVDLMNRKFVVIADPKASLDILKARLHKA
jgi:large subunit ribosomal protein L4